MLDLTLRPLASVIALPPDFLAAGGDMGERMRTHDWSRSALGPAREWPSGLKIAVRILLAARQPMCILWGASHTLLFNDAFRAVLGDRHAAMFAQPASASWSEFWEAAGHRVDLALQRNEGSSMDALALAAHRAGRREESRYNVVFCPLPGEPAATGGVLCTFTGVSASPSVERPEEDPHAEMERLNRAVARNERIYRAIGESLDYGVWTANREGRVTYVSDSFLDLLGCTVADWTGQDWHRYVHPDDAEGLLAAWRECVREGRHWDRELRVRGVDRKWHAVLQRAVPMRDEDGQVCGFAGIHLDIGRLKQVETELRELDQRKNEFLATLAHELRNPLAPLRNGLEVLRIAHDNKPMTEKARAMMQRQLQQMVRLVDDLLDVSRVSRGKIELRRDNIELAAVLRNAIETSQPLMAERGHELVVRIPQDRIVVHADMTRLSQVFWNLLNNAAKYTEAGGRIELAVAMAGGNVAVTVRDNGIGIPPEMHGRVFDIFTQVDRSLE
jgi:PAS domain S-box-containing protein